MRRGYRLPTIWEYIFVQEGLVFWIELKNYRLFFYRLLYSHNKFKDILNNYYYYSSLQIDQTNKKWQLLYKQLKTQFMSLVSWIMPSFLKQKFYFHIHTYFYKGKYGILKLMLIKYKKKLLLKCFNIKHCHHILLVCIYLHHFMNVSTCYPDHKCIKGIQF